MFYDKIFAFTKGIQDSRNKLSAELILKTIKINLSDLCTGLNHFKELEFTKLKIVD